jgi:hypothetical protein
MRREVAVALFALWTAGAAHAAGAEGRWSVSVQGGIDLEIAGDAIAPAQGVIAGLPTSLGAVSYAGAYSRSFAGSLSLAYRATPRVEVFGRGGRIAMDGRAADAGSAEGLALVATLGRYEQWSAEAGVRFLVGGGGAWQPYVAAVAGARFLTATPVTLSVPDANLEAADLAFRDASTVAVLGGDAGIDRRLSSHLGLGVEVGLRYQAGATPLDSGLDGSGLEAANDGGSRWSLPVAMRLTIRF